ncbi:MAG: cation diffusion facilitator family transporter [Muribaculaceae bacterium]
MIHKHHYHHHHGGAAITAGKAFKWGITLNLAFVAAEFVFGWLSNSMGLMSDAGHNLSDVASMALALAAGILATKQGSEKYSYGYRKSTILISVANAVILLVAVGMILIESIGKMVNPEPVEGNWIIIVAGTGVFVNGFTTWLFNKDKEKDLNIRATYLHMLADTLVSVGVIVSGVAIYFTGWNIIDPIVGIVIALVILASTWRLLKDSVRLALDGTPEQFDVTAINSKMCAVKGVVGIHHIHIWAISTTQYALTCHVLVEDVSRMAEIKSELKELLAKEGIGHATLEFEDMQHICEHEACELDN